MIKYTREVLTQAVGLSKSVSDVIRHLNKNISGSLHRHLSARIAFYEIDTTHFKRGNRTYAKTRRGGIRKRSPKEVLIYGRQESCRILRPALIAHGIAEVCAVCGLGVCWNNQTLRLQIDHIDGNRLNNQLENLRFLCPNCHSQTPTYGIRNRR